MLRMRPMFNLGCFASQSFLKTGVAQVSFRNSSSKINDVKEETPSFFSSEDDVEEEEIKAREAAIEKKRNKSELFPSDYNKQHNRPPYEEPQWEYHESLLYKRRMYGKYGELSKVDPSLLWPTKEELDFMKNYEEVAQPFTFQALFDRAKERKDLAEKKQKEEEEEILEKVKNIKYEMIEFHKRVAAQKKKALALIEQKNKLIDKVRLEIGYKIDVRNPKFQEVFEKLEKEEKKRLKLERKNKRNEMKKLMEDSQKANNEKGEEKSEDQTFT